MKKQIKLVCMGDSLTEGYGISAKDRWSNLLSRETGWEIINSGISGDTTAGMLARFQPMVIDHHPSHVIIMGGTNDLSLHLSDEQILSNIHAMTRQARYHQIEAIIGIPTPMVFPELVEKKSFYLETAFFSKRLTHFQEQLRIYTKEDDHPCIDFSTLTNPEWYLPDGLHPNESGNTEMKKMALNVLQALIS